VDQQTSERLYLREELRQELEKRGFKMSESYFGWLCRPSVNKGPPVEKYFGKRGLHRLDRGLSWAESRCGSSPGKIAA
jgi:hypothetical protein